MAAPPPIALPLPSSEEEEEEDEAMDDDDKEHEDYEEPLPFTSEPSFRETVAPHVSAVVLDRVLTNLLAPLSVAMTRGSGAAALSAHEAWLRACSKRCFRDSCVERTLCAPRASVDRHTALRRYSRMLLHEQSFVMLAQRSALLQTVAGLPDESSMVLHAAKRPRTADAEMGGMVPQAVPAALDAAAPAPAPVTASVVSTSGAITADSLSALLKVVTSEVAPYALLKETLSLLAQAGDDLPPHGDPSRTFRSFFSHPWHPQLRKLPTPQLDELYACAGYLGLPLDDCVPIVREAAQRLANSVDTSHRARARWEEGDPESLLLFSAQRLFRTTVEGLSAPPITAILREALSPTSAPAITRLITLLKGWGSPHVGKAFGSLEFEERCFLATARGMMGGSGGGSIIAAVLFGHADASELGRLDRAARASAWMLLVRWGGAPPADVSLKQRAAAQYAIEYAPYEAAGGRPQPAAPSLTRMLLEVVSERMGFGSAEPITAPLLDAAACHVPAVFEHLHHLHATPRIMAPFDVLHSAPELEAAFRSGTTDIVRWAIQTGMLPMRSCMQVNGFGPTTSAWELGNLASSWLEKKKKQPLQLLFARGYPIASCTVEFADYSYKLPVEGVDWAVREAAMTGDIALVAWVIAELVPPRPAGKTSLGPAALFGAAASGDLAILRAVLATGVTVLSEEDATALFLYALTSDSMGIAQELWQQSTLNQCLSKLDLSRIPSTQIFNAAVEGYSGYGGADGDSQLVTVLLTLRGMGVRISNANFFCSYLQETACEDLSVIQKFLLQMWAPGDAAPPVWMDGTVTRAVMDNATKSYSDAAPTVLMSILQWCCDTAGCSLGDTDTCSYFEGLLADCDSDLPSEDPAALLRWKALAAMEGSALPNTNFEGAYSKRLAPIRKWLMTRKGGCPCGGGLHYRQRLADIEWEAAEAAFAAPPPPNPLPG